MVRAQTTRGPHSKKRTTATTATTVSRVPCADLRDDGRAMWLSRTLGRGDAEGGATGRDAMPRGSTATGTPRGRVSATSRPTSSCLRARPDASRRAFRPRARFGVSPSRSRHGDADHRAERSRRRSDVARTTREPSGIVIERFDAVSAPFASSTAPRVASGRRARPRGFLGFTDRERPSPDVSPARVPATLSLDQSIRTRR